VSSEQPIEMILDLLRAMVSRKASDLFISVGFPPALKIDGKVTPISDKVFNVVQTRSFARALIALAIMSPVPLAHADGKFYSDRIPPELPYQRAIVTFDGARETLLVESKLEAKEGERFGWVVPVPSVPDLASPDPRTVDRRYSWLEENTQPRVINLKLVAVLAPYACWILYRLVLRVRRGKRMLVAVFIGTLAYLALLWLVLPKNEVSARKSSAVLIVKEERVGPYEAKVLRGDSASDLFAWFKENGFAFDDRDRAAIDSYVARRWVFVAAKLDRDAKGAQGKMVPPLQLTFPAREAVYPLVLTGTGGSTTEILLYVFASGRMDDGGRLPLHFSAELRGAYLEQAYVTKFRGQLAPEQMRTDLVLKPAAFNASYRPVEFTW